MPHSAVPGVDPDACGRDGSGQRSETAASFRTYALVALGILLAYVFLHFVVMPGNRLVSFPVHHDDYNNLAHTRIALRMPLVRPVSTLALVLLSCAGITTYYLALHALTVSYVFLVFVFVIRFFEVRSVRLVQVACAATVVFSFEHVVEYYKYTGLITNLVSANLGVAAFLCVLQYCRTNRWLALLLGLLFSAGSLLAKEDFILAILLVPAAAAFVGGERSAWKRGLFVVAILAVLSAVAYGVFVAHNPFVASHSGTYKSVFSPSSLAATTVRYLTFSRVTSAGSAIQVLSLAMALFFAGSRRCFRKELALLALTLALIVPYACLPSHVYGYYCFNWLPFQAASLMLLSAGGRSETSPLFKGAVRGIALISVMALAFWTHPARRQMVDWYSRQSALNENIVATVLRHKDVLNSQEVVGVTGVPLLNPWFATDGGFLVNRFGIQCRWVIFVEKESHYYRTIVSLLHGTQRGGVETADLADVDRLHALPVLALGPDGTGTMLMLPGRAGGVLGTHAGLTVTPSRVAVCDGSGLAVVSVSWSVPDSTNLEVRVGAPGGPLLTQRSGNGSANTGKWVTDGMVFYLQDVTGGHPLTTANTLATATAHVTSEGCR